MAEEDKLVNVVLKYRQEGADQVARSSDASAKNASASFEQMRANFSKMTEDQVKSWEKVPVKYNAGIDQMRANFNKLTEEQLRNWEKIGKAADAGQGTGGGGKGPASPGGPLDPEGPRKFNTELNQTQQKLQQLKNTAENISQVGSFATALGGVLTAGIVANANNYVKTMGTINESSAEWLGYQEDIKQSNLEIGQVTTQALLPAMKAAAEFSNDIAQLVKEHPWLIQAATYAGGAMLAIGAASTVIAQITRAVASVGLIITKIEAAQAKQLELNAMGGFGGGEYGPGGGGGGLAGTLSTVTLMATSVIIGAEIGAAIGNWLGEIIYGAAYQKQGLDDALVTFTKIVQLPWKLVEAEIAKLPPELAKAGVSIVEFLATILTAGTYNGAKAIQEGMEKGGAEQEAEQSALISEQEVQSFISFQKQIAAAEQTYGQQRLDIVRQFEQQKADATAAYEAQRADIIKQYESQIAQVTANYEAQRLQAIENYESQVAKATANYLQSQERAQAAFELAQKRAAEQHAKEMQRMEEDHNSRILDLAGQRDALGIVKENQAYEEKRSRAEEDYRLQEQQREEDFRIAEQQRQEDYEQQLAELKENFDKQQAAAKEAHDKQLAEMAAQEKERLAKLDEQHKVEMQKLDEQEKAKLTKLKDAYDKQIEQIQTAFIDRLRALDATILGDTAAFEGYMQQQAQEFQQWLNDFKAAQQTGTPSTGAPETGVVSLGAGGGSGVGSMSDLIPRASRMGMIPAFLASKEGAMGGPRSLHVTVQSRSLTLSEMKQQIDSSLNQKLSDLLPAFGV